MLSSKTLKEIVAEARPIIERQLDDAERIAAFREVVTVQGGDWSSLKALIKAQIQDERDDGKRVEKILAKAEFATGYADMLGWSKMNENIFSADEEFNPFTGELLGDEPIKIDRDARRRQRTSEAMDDNIALSAEMLADGLISEEAHAENIAISNGVARKYGNGPIQYAPATQGEAGALESATEEEDHGTGEDDQQHVGRTDDEQRDAPRVSRPDGRGEGDDESDQGQGAGASGTDRHSRPVEGTLDREDEDGGSRHVGGEARHEITDAAISRPGKPRPEIENRLVEEPLKTQGSGEMQDEIAINLPTNSPETANESPRKAAEAVSERTRDAVGRPTSERQSEAIGSEEGGVTGGESAATQFQASKKTIADYRPHCLKPDACGSSRIDQHCYSCSKAMAANGEAAA